MTYFVVLDNHFKNYEPFNLHVDGSRKATSAGNLKLAQNILLLGATSRTSWIDKSGSPTLTSWPNFLLILSQISISSLALSALLVEKQCTCTIGSLALVWGSKSFSWPQ